MVKVELGDRVKDIISGQEGIVIGVTDYIYGCRRVGVSPEETKDGVPVENFWTDEPQLEVLQKKVVVAGKPKKKKRTGGPREDAQPRPDAQR